MHFSIPDTQELNDENGSTYTGYNIHINGIYHCTVRFKQLHNLHEQLRRKCGNNLPQFPPKKLLPLTSFQLSERRSLLEKYIQTVGQEPRFASSDIFNGFLLTAQQETRCERSQETNMDVYLMNGHQIHLTLLTTDRSDQVLNKVCQQINLPEEYVNYFALFIINKHDNGDITILRKLEDFESPYLSQKLFPNKDMHRIVLRKMYWDPGYDLELMCHPVSLNLLYVQTVSDIERGWTLCSKEILAQLATLQARGAKREYLEIARTLKYYSYMQFGLAVCDYPEPNTTVLLALGKRELSMRLPGEKGNSSIITREGCFKVTRIRCWRITTVRQTDINPHTSNGTQPDTQLELSFEYLMSKDKLRWINVSSDQVIFISVCLQSMVDELLLKKNGFQLKHINEREHHDTNWSYMRRDGSKTIVKSKSNNGLNEFVTHSKPKTPVWSEPFSMKKLQEKFASAAHHSGQEFIENDAFEDIGDDDL